MHFPRTYLNKRSLHYISRHVIQIYRDLLYCLLQGVVNADCQSSCCCYKLFEVFFAKLSSSFFDPLFHLPMFSFSLKFPAKSNYLNNFTTKLFERIDLQFKQKSIPLVGKLLSEIARSECSKRTTSFIFFIPYYPV